MPTLKAIHICNYSRILSFILEFVNFVSLKPNHQPKLAKEYVYPTLTEKKIKSTTAQQRYT